MTTYTERVRQLLRTTGGMTLAQLMEALPEDADRNSVNTMCHQRCRAGEFTRSVEDGQTVFRLRQDGGDGGGVAITPDTETVGKVVATKPRVRRAKAPSATPDDNVRASLLASHTAANAAIEAYVVAMGGDLVIYRSLVDVRENTRRVLAEYITRGA